MPKTRSRWADVPDAAKEKMRENARLARLQRKQEAAARREERQRLGVGRSKTTQVRIPRDSLNRLRACAFMTQAIATISGVEPEWVGYRFSMCEEVRRLVDAQFRKIREQLEYLVTSTDPRAEMALDKANMLDSGWT